MSTVDDYSMDNIDSADETKTDVEEKEEKPSAKETFQEKVNSIVSKMSQKEDGSWALPEEITSALDEATLYAVTIERRYRDTQASYTKAQQKSKALEVTNTELTNHLISNATLHLTAEEREELDDLRTSDPEAWRAKLNEHEQKAKDLQKSKINEFSEKGNKASEEELRRAAYEEFTARTNIVLSDEVLENQVPAGYQKKLQNGTWTFEKFLAEVETFLSPKKVAGANKGKTEDNPPNMNTLPGDKAPSKEAQEGDAAISYENEIY